jgi:hypothetical protein
MRGQAGHFIWRGQGTCGHGAQDPPSLVQALLPANQEMMGENDHGYVMVPPAPEPQLVVVHAQFPLALVFPLTVVDNSDNPPTRLTAR